MSRRVAGLGGAIAILVLVAVFFATRGERDRGSPTASNVEAPAVSPVSKTPWRSAQPARLGPRDLANQVDVDDEFHRIPTVPDLDRMYPGLARSYADTYREARAASIQRSSWRCVADVPPGTSVEWDTIETYANAGDGSLKLAALEVLPRTLTAPDVVACITDGILAANLSVPIPPDLTVPESIQIRNVGRINNSDMTREEIVSALDELRQQSTAPGLSDAMIRLIQQQIDLFQCYLDQGLENRAKCRSR